MPWFPTKAEDKPLHYSTENATRDDVRAWRSHVFRERGSEKEIPWQRHNTAAGSVFPNLGYERLFAYSAFSASGSTNAWPLPSIWRRAVVGSAGFMARQAAMMSSSSSVIFS